jgi:hypothetical protein
VRSDDEALRLSEVEVLACFRIGLQARPVRFVRGEARERDQSPGDVVGAFVRQEVADQMAAASRDDAALVLGVGPELVALKWIDVVSDETGHGHRCAPSVGVPSSP